MKDPERPERRFFKQCKCNNAPDDLPAVAFQIEKTVIEFEGEKIETAIPVFDTELHAVDLNRLVNGDRNRSGPAPVKSSRFADWLYEELKNGKQVRFKILLERARDKDLLRSPTDTDKNPSVKPLYDARDRLPDLHPGWIVQTEKKDVAGMQYPIAFWQLIPEGEALEEVAAENEEEEDSAF